MSNACWRADWWKYLFYPARGVSNLLVLAAAAWLPHRALAQTETKIRAETRVVPVDVTVTDANGRPVRDLTRDDFTILDEGAPRTIRIFSFP